MDADHPDLAAHLAAGAAAVQWFHSIDLGGFVTPGIKAHEILKAEAETVFSYPVAGRSFLDVGAWDGYFSFEAERRGAARVLATDHFCWGGAGWGTKAGFDFARAALGSRIEARELDLFDITPDAVGMFDVVLLSGVLYHVTDPLAVLRQVAKVATGCVVVETVLGAMENPEPAMSFLHAAGYNNDPTNFWAPNPACVAAMMTAAGFRRVMFAEHPMVPLSTRPMPRGYFFGIR